jgi:hypothetical protein
MGPPICIYRMTTHIYICPFPELKTTVKGGLMVILHLFSITLISRDIRRADGGSSGWGVK